MAQVVVTAATWKSLVKPPAFAKGFDEAWRGAPPRYDLDPPPGGGLATNRTWAYERGRAFAVYCKATGRGDPRPFKHGNRIPYYIVDMLCDAKRAGFLI